MVKEKSIFMHHTNALMCLKEARKIARLYELRFGKKEAGELPAPVCEEWVKEFVKSMDRERIWERVERLKMERNSYYSKAGYYEVKYRKTRKREDRKKALFYRYMYYLLRREVVLFYAELLKIRG